MKRVAVVLFCEIDTDAPDADHLAVITVSRLLGRNPSVLPRIHPPGSKDPWPEVRVQEVQEAGMAAGNGYLWMQPTSKAYRYSSIEETA